MTFDEVLGQIRELLASKGRVLDILHEGIASAKILLPSTALLKKDTAVGKTSMLLKDGRRLVAT
jgi:hypothetical protein